MLSKVKQKAADELVNRAMGSAAFGGRYGKHGSGSKPGQMIQDLSKEEKEIVQQLKPEHFKGRLFK